MRRGRGAIVATAVALGGCNALFGVDDLAYQPDQTQSSAASSAQSSAATGGGSSSAGGGIGPGGSGGEAGAGGAPSLQLTYQRPITITTSSAPMPAGYVVSVELDHAALVSAGKSLGSGDDVRLFRQTDGGLVEGDRVLTTFTSWNSPTTALHFRATDAIGADGSDTTYLLRYGDPQAGSPPADPAQIFDVWDDFTGPSLDSAWQTASIGTAADTSVTLGGGVVRLMARSEEIGPNNDDLFFLHRSVSGSFLAEAMVSARGGGYGSVPHFGGVMLRQSLNDGVPMRVIAPTDHDGGTVGFFDDWRDTSGEIVIANDVPGTPTLPAYTGLGRIGAASTSFYSADLEQSITGASHVITMGLNDPLLVGIPFANDSSAVTGWVEIDWFRVRKAILPVPVTILGDEQAIP